MLVVNFIDKDRIRGEDGLGDSTAVWRARLVLFIGFALMAGGLAGSVVSVYCSLFGVKSLVLTIYALPLLPSRVVDCPHFEVHRQAVRGTVHILRLRKCFPECRPHVVRYRSLDIAEHKWRVRVQSFHLVPFILLSCMIIHCS